MSQHPSLRSSEKDKKHRSVLKRYERIKSLKEKEKWEDDDSVFGLPKVKILRFKIKKEKAAAEETAETAVPGTEAAAGPASGAKAASQTKASGSGKEAAKPQTPPAGGEGKKSAK